MCFDDCRPFACAVYVLPQVAAGKTSFLEAIGRVKSDRHLRVVFLGPAISKDKLEIAEHLLYMFSNPEVDQGGFCDTLELLTICQVEWDSFL
jgi:hypothetical protein